MVTDDTGSVKGEHRALLSPRSLTLQPVHQEPPPSPQRVRRTPYVIIVTALVATLIVASIYATTPQSRGRVVVRNSFGEEVTELRDKACSEYPYLKFKMPGAVMHSNLAGKGPDHGAEGIMYDTIDLGQGAGIELGHQVLMVINATSSNYRPFSPRLNGMQGKYGSINVQSGSKIDLKFTFYDRRSMDRYELPEAAFTFFDLDTGKHEKSVESVTIGKNYRNYHLTDDTEVKVTDLGDKTRFAGTTYGTGDDNPTDPMRLTAQQKNRAVTITFDDLRKLEVTLEATAGVGPRFFTFVSRPSLMCAVTVQEGFKPTPPLEDIIAEAPLQQSVQGSYDDQETFDSLLVSPGQQVKAGDPIFKAKQPDGSIKTYTAPIDGTVKATQDKLKKGDDMALRLDNKTVAVIERPQFDALASDVPNVVPGGPAQVPSDPPPPNPADLDGFYCGPGCAGGPGHEAPPGGTPADTPPQVSKDATFVKYLKEPGEPVSPGEPIMVVKDGDKLVAVTADKIGKVRSRDEDIKEGDKIPAPGPLALVDIRPEVTGDAQFVEYLKEVGDPVAVGDPLYKVNNAVGDDVIIKAKTIGVVKERQEEIKPGDPIAVSKDKNLMTIGPVPALPTDENCLKSGTVTKQGQELVKITAKPGDLIKKGDPIAIVKDIATGEESPVLAEHDGLVTGVNDQLKPGDPIDRSEDRNLVTTGKFPPLPVNPPKESPTNNDDSAGGPGSTFVKYNVEPGELVSEGDTIATVKKPDGTEVPVKATKAGTVVKTQDALQPGMVLDDVMQDQNLATIKEFEKFPPLPMEPPDDAPTPSDADKAELGPEYDDAKFVKYHVKEGDVVHEGDKIATVEMPDGTEKDILAGKSGIVKAIQDDIKPGMKMSDVMEDDNLATIGEFDKFPPLPVSESEGEAPANFDEDEIGPEATFVKYNVKPGDTVHKGQPIATVKKKDGTEVEILAPKPGVVKDIQEGLQPGMILKDSLEDENLATIGKLPPLSVAVGEGGSCAPSEDPCPSGAPQTPDPDDLEGYWCGPKCEGGPDFQEEAEEGAAETTTPKPDDLEGFWCGPGCHGGPGLRGPPHGTAPGTGPTPQTSKEGEFVEYLKTPGDEVKAGDPILTVKDGDEEVEVTAPKDGMVTKVKQDINAGDVIPDPGPLALVTIGPPGGSPEEVFPQVSKDVTFVEYLKEPGEDVAPMEPIMKVKDGDKIVAVTSPKLGVVKSRNEDMKEGDPIPAPGPLALMDIFSPPKPGEKPPGAGPPGAGPPGAGPPGAAAETTTTPKPEDLEGYWCGPSCKGGPSHPGPPGGGAPEAGGPIPQVSKDGTFVEYLKEPGDPVKEGEPMLTVQDEGEEVEVTAPKDGVVKNRDEDIKKGDEIPDPGPLALVEIGDGPTTPKPDALAPDGYWCGPGCAGGPSHPGPKTPPGGDPGAAPPPGGPIPQVAKDGTFVKYLKEVGDPVATGEPMLTVKDQGTTVAVTAPKDGEVLSRNEDMKEGDEIPEPGPISLVEIGPAEGDGPPFTSPPEESPEDDEGPWAFDRWEKNVGDPVTKGDPLAVLKNTETGKEKPVKAGKSGNVISRQEALRQGDVIDEVMSDTDLAVIGKFNEPSIGLTEKAVSAPMDAIFVKWYAKVGEKVKSGDSIAQVRTGVKTAGGRRLMSNFDIPTPGSGKVVEEMDLKPGQSIGDQSLTPSIAKIDIGWPWWLLFLLALMVLCCVFCCFYLAMKKPKPPYVPMPAEPPPAEPEPPVPVAEVVPPPPEPVPDGLRLDFEDEGVVKTVYAKWRPLGIKHNFVAPIVAHDFTVNSYAKQELGVKDGWKLRRIGDEELNDNPDFKEVNGKLYEYMKDFQLWPLPLEFAEQLENNERKHFKFTERPIGIEFKNRAPIEVEKIFPDSPAGEQGVQVGWYVTRIGDFEVTENTTFHEVMTAFKEGVTPLNDVGKSYQTSGNATSLNNNIAKES